MLIERLLFASITGAWIETWAAMAQITALTFASITGAWIETAAGTDYGVIAPIRVHHGRVD